MAEHRHKKNTRPNPKLQFVPGQTVLWSGIYKMYMAGEVQKEVTCTKGEPFPPTNESGGYFQLHRLTQH